MKKLFIISFLIAVALFACNPAGAQIATLNINEPNTYVEYSTNVTLTDAVAQHFIINAPQDWYTAQAYTVNLDSLTGSHTKIAVVLAGQHSDVESAWTTISTTNWIGTVPGTGVDTTMTVINATENGYRRFKITFTGTGTGTTRIDNFEFKQYFGLP
jgi:hypothetical protein